MSVESADDLAVFFNTDEDAIAANYVPPGGGASTPCVIRIDPIEDQQPVLSGRIVKAGHPVLVRASEIATPAQGGKFVAGAVSYVIVGEPVPADATGNIWRCKTG